MKKIIIIFALFITLTNCKAQEGRIEPLSSYGDFPSGTYYKDIDDIMRHYIGTWIGIHNGKHIVIKIEKLVKNKHISGDGSYYYEDEMIGRYMVFNGDPEIPGTIIIATSMNQANELTPLFSVGSGRNNEFAFKYRDYQFCKAEGD